MARPVIFVSICQVTRPYVLKGQNKLVASAYFKKACGSLSELQSVKWEIGSDYKTNSVTQVSLGTCINSIWFTLYGLFTRLPRQLVDNTLQEIEMLLFVKEIFYLKIFHYVIVALAQEGYCER